MTGRTVPTDAEEPANHYLISYLRYALDDVRAVSDRGAELLEQAIAAVALDIGGPRYLS